MSTFFPVSPTMAGMLDAPDAKAGAQALSLLGKGRNAVVVGMVPAENDEQRAVQMRLRELGFVPGEELRIVAESFPGRDPIAVRLGSTTFALRRFEAAMVRVVQS
jgi:ferrous iron transport protein A